MSIIAPRSSFATFYGRIILSICFLLQPTTASLDLECETKGSFGDVERFSVSSASGSHLVVSLEPNHHVFPKHPFNLTVRYRPCRHLSASWPTLERDPLTDIYLARYDIDETSYAWNTIGSYKFHSPARVLPSNDSTPTTITVLANLTDLRFPDSYYLFDLQRVDEFGSSKLSSVHVVGRTYPDPPKVCAGCFRILSTRRRQNKREVRVYWRNVIPMGLYSVAVFEEGSKHKSTVREVMGPLEYGFVDIWIGMKAHSFVFHSISKDSKWSRTNSTVVVPDEVNVLNWLPRVAMTANATQDTHTLSWEKPTNVSVDSYTLVWYDKRKWRENSSSSPVMDWIYISSNRTKVEFRMLNFSDAENVGWRLSANTKISSSGIRNFDND